MRLPSLFRNKGRYVEGILPSILTMTICMLNYYHTCCYVCSLRESLTVVDRGSRISKTVVDLSKMLILRMRNNL